MLHVTNGESVIHSFRAAEIDGAYLAWLDVLHEGPVPDLPLAELSAVRARALADFGWGEYAEVRRAFAARALAGKDRGSIPPHAARPLGAGPRCRPDPDAACRWDRARRVLASM